MKIYVAGHRGLVGSAIVRQIEGSGQHTWVGKTRKELNLFDMVEVDAFLAHEKPDAIILAAAKVGGIGANSNFPVEFLTENLRIELNIMESAHKQDINRLVFLGSSCIYPKFAQQPIQEGQLLAGALEITNEPYALAKIAGLKLAASYRRQYGRDWVSAMPCNIYGPGDNFDLETGHVLPVLIKRFHDAKTSGNPLVTLWGDGTPLREFLHSDDLASAVLYIMDNYHEEEHINVGSGSEISISELAKTIAAVVGFDGEIHWDSSKPNGTPRKILDTTKLTRLGWNNKISLSSGISDTYQSFINDLKSQNN
jgi:GDP-L-fucose synthase